MVGLTLGSGCEPLTPDDIAEVIVFTAGRRENLVVADVLLLPNHQVRKRTFIATAVRYKAKAKQKTGSSNRDAPNALSGPSQSQAGERNRQVESDIRQAESRPHPSKQNIFLIFLIRMRAMSGNDSAGERSGRAQRWVIGTPSFWSIGSWSRNSRPYGVMFLRAARSSSTSGSMRLSMSRR